MSRKYLAGMISLLLVFFATRLIAIDQFPMFTDEAFHIRFARNVVDKGVLSNAEEGRQLTIWLYTLVQADQNAARHGRSKADRALDAARSDKALQDHEAHRRDDDE